jgi:DNA-binding transcriptional MerR regulator
MTAKIEELWSIQDVSRYLKIPVKTLYRWRCQGYGPKARRLGKHLRYKPDDVRVWFESRGADVT